MKEVLLTSSVLIAALLVLRGVFRNSAPRRVQYALWGLVLLRLLLPVSLPAANFSVLSAAQPVRGAVEARFEARQSSKTTAPQTEKKTAPQPAAAPAPVGGFQAAAPSAPAAPALEGHEDGAPQSARGPSLTTVLHYIWLAGSAAVGAFFLLSNLRFWRRLRKYRTPFAVEGFKRPVYLTGEGVLSSPCLFGFPRPAVYLTPAALTSEDTLRHVLAHEDTHARHLDPLWALLRCVCLSVYWFNPLVWAAAFAAKADCELACDESVMERLGEGERLGYGRTLLSIAPVGKGPSNPLLTATTMTAGKRQLKNRLSRIARRPRRLIAGTLAVALLAGALTACTFTGAEESPSATPDSTPTPAPVSTPAPTPTEEQSGSPESLTEEELRWFNNEFFNNFNNPDGDGDTGINIRNQFANPLNLYEKPQLIDLGALLYCSGSAPSDEELRTVLDTDPDNMVSPAYKITTQEINAILKENAGLTLGEMNRSSLDFTYSREYDAYYWMHGDTNYPGDLVFFCGTRENAKDGDRVRLYQNSGFSGDEGWYCVTLSEREDGSYWFVSNLACEPPAIPPAMPKGTPSATIPLTDLAPWRVPLTEDALPTVEFSGDYEDRFANWDIDGHHVQIYRATDGNIYAVAEQADGSDASFLSNITGDCFLVPFHDLFGRSGFYVGYYALGVGNVYDFFYFDGGDIPVRMLQCIPGTPSAVMFLDLNGDGKLELACNGYLYFQRDGEIYEANLARLLIDACPELGEVTNMSWEPCGRYCIASGTKEGGEQWACKLFFDGGNIQVYPLIVLGVATVTEDTRVDIDGDYTRVHPLT